jgi:hypothetical protein
MVRAVIVIAMEAAVAVAMGVVVTVIYKAVG